MQSSIIAGIASAVRALLLISAPVCDYLRKDANDADVRMPAEAIATIGQTVES